MIIELTGIPGAGKSTVINTLIREVPNKKYIFDVKKYILQNWIFSIDNVIFYDFILLTKLFLLTKEDIYLLKYIFMIIKNSHNSFFHKVNIIRNTLKKILIYRYIKNKEDIFFIDEGVTHIAFTVFVDIGKVLDQDKLQTLLDMLPKIDKLIIIEAPYPILLQRVIDRGRTGHRRINFDSKQDIESFLKQSNIVLDAIQKHFNSYIYKNITTNINANQIIEMVGLKNV